MNVVGGSMTTVAKFMNVWRNESPAVSVNAAALPSGLLRELEALQRNAEKAVRDACMAELSNARESEQALIQENEQLQADLASLQVSMNGAQEDATRAQIQLSQVQADNAGLKSMLENERSCISVLQVDLAKATLRFEEAMPRLLQELCECREELALARKAQVAAEIAAAVAAERVNGAEQRLRNH
ncbi:hypothetical protein CTS44_12088 [Comamonas thiooxydans]|nr:hypothetical protein CTS44_12088 [Comamonas thiooxydans]